MIELVLTLNDKDGNYAKHAGVVLASIFSNTQQTINVHIVHDDTLSEENKAKLAQLVEAFHHNIYFYHVTVPGDLQEVAASVNKIDYWTIASMYRLLLPLIIPADRVIYLDCDIMVNMDINDLWSIDLGDRYMGAVLDQGQNLLEYFATLGLDPERYFNSGVILFHLDNIRNRPTWYVEMLDFLRRHPTVTMPDQDVLNAVYGSHYIQMEQRFNTFAQPGLDLENRIVHFAGDSKWWDNSSPAIHLYNNFLAMTPWGRDYSSEPVSEPQQVNITPEPPALEMQPVDHPVLEPPAPEAPAADASAPAPEASAPASDGVEPAPEAVPPAPEMVASVPVHQPVKRRRRRRRRSLRLRLRPRKRRVIRAKSRSIKRVKLIKRLNLKRKKALPSTTKKLRPVRRKRTLKRIS
ncbi:glycosyltransferase family 8 protein [Paenibacillus sp. M1]|uniref:Glycosyltransferase family 8 protein n=1 Tax=Paenibacillus haidiansis TaxID=1574488 RepID=A0ABU7VS51_9BACL